MLVFPISGLEQRRLGRRGGPVDLDRQKRGRGLQELRP
jgi:hypothetical protein